MTMDTVIALIMVENSTICAAKFGWLLYSCAITALFTEVGMAEAINSACATIPSILNM